jgi:hypothetical protein
MTHASLQEVQRGWKVYAGNQQVGTVSAVAPDQLTLEKGRLMRHHYRVPIERVAEAAAGVVDLNIGPGEMVAFETKT